MITPSTAAGLVILILVYTFFKFKPFTRLSLSLVPRPQSPSFFVGNLLELFQRPAGEADFAWQSQYGDVVRFKGVFGEDRLFITDHKAVRKILNSYTYPRPTTARVIDHMIIGKGLICADSDDHKRQKSIMVPGLGPNECKSFLPIFKDCAESISTKWSETIASDNSDCAIINVLDLLSRGTLDGLGRALFDIEFGTVQDDFHPLAKAYKNCLNDVFGLPSETQIFFQAVSKYLPIRILHWMAENVPNHRLARARNLKAVVTSVAKELLQEKADTLLQDNGNKDIFSLLVKANMDASAKKKLSDEELYSGMGLLLIAGHETTANTLAWTLLELARNSRVQSMLREEIRKTEATVHARGDSHLTVTDLESMPYLNAVIKEVLRLHPATPNTLRIAGQDDVVPLSKPILTESGDMMNEVHVPKGTEIVVSIAAYNRDKEHWGEDAHEFNPDRWLNGAMDDGNLPRIGVYSNLLTFSSGTRACIGWRFALIELRAFLSTLVGKFEFSITDRAERIIRQSVFAMVPLVDGELEQGVQMPLAVSLAPQGDI